MASAKLLPWPDIKLLLAAGVPCRKVARLIGVSEATLPCALKRQNLDLEDLSDVPEPVWIKWRDELPAYMQQSHFTDDDAADGLSQIPGSDLTWEDVKDYLATGLTLLETAAAVGTTPAALEEQYELQRPANFESIEIWSTVLRARRSYETMKAIELRALDGDIKAAKLLQKMRYQRHPEDSCAPPED